MFELKNCLNTMHWNQLRAFDMMCSPFGLINATVFFFETSVRITRQVSTNPSRSPMKSELYFFVVQSLEGFLRNHTRLVSPLL